MQQHTDSEANIGESSPLLPTITPTKKRRFHSALLLYFTALDLSVSSLLFGVYVAIHTLGNPAPLYLLAVAVARVVLLAILLLEYLTRWKIPLITTFTSLLFLVITSRWAATIEAWVTLLASFIFSWGELSIYLHAQTSYGGQYWENQFEYIYPEEEVDEEFDLVFPESPSYVFVEPKQCKSS